jgi:phage shock protein PspC (stress-responsive transcriptional regulator)
MVVEVVEAVAGLLDMLSTWRFSLLAVAGIIGGYATRFAVESHPLRLLLFVVVFLAACWCGWRWQKAAEQRSHSGAKPSSPRHHGAP